MTSSALSAAREALQWAFAQLAQVTDRPHTEAERLLAWVLHVDRTTVLAHPEWLLTPEQGEQFRGAIERRAANVPLPYILGHMEFFGSEFCVTPAVLIPRPETELLVELALHRIQHQPRSRVVDVGTGSGCIAVTLAIKLQRPHLGHGPLGPGAGRSARDNAGVTTSLNGLPGYRLTS